LDILPSTFGSSLWFSEEELAELEGATLYGGQGSSNRWEPVWFDRLPVKSVRPGGPNSKFKFKFKKMKKISKNS